MFCLVLLNIFYGIFKADAIIVQNVPRHLATENPFQRGSVNELIQSYESRSGSGAGKTEIAEVRLNNYTENANFTAWKDEPLKIIIENFYPRYIWCNNKYVKSGDPSPESFVPETEFANNIVCILNIPKVTAKMNTRWVCTVLQVYREGNPYPYKGLNYTAQDLHFNLHVNGAREQKHVEVFAGLELNAKDSQVPGDQNHVEVITHEKGSFFVIEQVILTANNQNLKYNVKTNLSVEYYVASYSYKDGEDVEFSCKKAQDETHPSDTVRLEYFNAKGIPLFKTEPGKKMHKFRSVLNFTNDKYYLDCICTSTAPFREYRYRTTFYMTKDAEQHAIKLFINGQRLTTMLNNEPTIDDYIFRYIDGEELNITCQEIHSFPLGSIHFDFDRNFIYREDRKNLKMGIISLRLLASNVNNKTLICGINYTEVYKPIIKLLFLSDVPDNGIRVRGLPRNNILYQYTNDRGQWTIEYQYSVNDTLNLTCVAKSVSSGGRVGLRVSPHFKWTVRGLTIDSPANWTQALPTIKTSGSKITEILNATHNGTKIKCTYFPKGTYDSYNNRTVEIILQLKPNQSETVNETNSPEVDTGKDIQMIVPIAVAFGVVVAIITMLCVICWHKRTKRTNLIENAYDNLSNQNDSPIPAFPSQWESDIDDSHYASIDEEVMQENYNYSTNDSLCKMPHKRSSNISENHYTEIDDYFKPNPDGLTANWNSAQPANNKNTGAPKGTASQNSNYAIYNNSTGTYDKLLGNNMPINKDNENYSNIQSKGKNKSVTFRQMSNDSRTASEYNEGNPRQDFRNNDQRLKPNNEGQYANTDQQDCRNNDQRLKPNNENQYANTDLTVYMQPGVMQKKPCYENNFLKKKESVNSADLDYAEPYDFRISCKK